MGPATNNAFCSSGWAESVDKKMVVEDAAPELSEFDKVALYWMYEFALDRDHEALMNHLLTENPGIDEALKDDLLTCRENLFPLRGLNESQFNQMSFEERMKYFTYLLGYAESKRLPEIELSLRTEHVVAALRPAILAKTPSWFDAKKALDEAFGEDRTLVPTFVRGDVSGPRRMADVHEKQTADEELVQRRAALETIIEDLQGRHKVRAEKALRPFAEDHTYRLFSVQLQRTYERLRTPVALERLAGAVQGSKDPIAAKLPPPPPAATSGAMVVRMADAQPDGHSNLPSTEQHPFSGDEPPGNATQKAPLNNGKRPLRDEDGKDGDEELAGHPTKAPRNKGKPSVRAEEEEDGVECEGSERTEDILDANPMEDTLEAPHDNAQVLDVIEEVDDEVPQPVKAGRRRRPSRVRFGKRMWTHEEVHVAQGMIGGHGHTF